MDQHYSNYGGVTLGSICKFLPLLPVSTWSVNKVLVCTLIPFIWPFLENIRWYINQPDKDLDEDLSASSPQFDSTRLPRTLTNELPRFNMAALRGAKWLNWTEDRQPMKPLDPAWRTSSSTPARPDRGKKTKPQEVLICWTNSVKLKQTSVFSAKWRIFAHQTISRWLGVVN